MQNHQDCNFVNQDILYEIMQHLAEGYHKNLILVSKQFARTVLALDSSIQKKQFHDKIYAVGRSFFKDKMVCKSKIHGTYVNVWGKIEKVPAEAIMQYFKNQISKRPFIFGRGKKNNLRIGSQVVDFHYDNYYYCISEYENNITVFISDSNSQGNGIVLDRQRIHLLFWLLDAHKKSKKQSFQESNYKQLTFQYTNGLYDHFDIYDAILESRDIIDDASRFFGFNRVMLRYSRNHHVDKKAITKSFHQQLKTNIKESKGRIPIYQSI